jgi:hypothetical protein
MARPSRSWVRKTYTVSPEVEKAIAIRAAKQGIPTGTVVDILVWNTLLKPDEDRLKKGDSSNDQLERIFAEEVLARLDCKGAVDALAESLDLDDDEKVNLRKVQALVGRWRTTRLIEKDHQEALLAALDDGKWLPSILRNDLVDGGWFLPE